MPDLPVMPVMPVMPDLIGHQEKEIPGQAGDDKRAAGDDKEDIGG
jgi:hypothetical protein